MKLILTLILCALTSFAAQIIPDSRRVSWQGNVGVAGGIPTVTTIYTNLYPTGGDDGDMIRQAMGRCPSNQVVMLCPGTFIVGGDIDYNYIGSGKIMRGFSPAQTRMVLTNGYIYMRGEQFREEALTNSVNLSQDAAKGSTVLHLAEMPSWIVVGGIYILDSLDDTNEVYAVDTSENETARSYREIAGAGPRGRGQTVKVTAKTADSISLEIPTYDLYPTSRLSQIAQCGYNPAQFRPLRRAGLESFTLEASYAYASGDMVTMENCDNSWIRNMVFTNVPGTIHLHTAFSYRCEIRDSVFTDSHYYGSGQGYGVGFYHVTSACLVENNIFKHLHGPLSVQYGSSGNVMAYNCILDGVSISGQAPSVSTHGVHAYMNLWEGNYCQNKVLFDWSHGSGGHNTVFRNRVLGYQAPLIRDQTVVSIEYYNRHCNIVGNVLGYPGWHNTYAFAPTQTCQDESRPIFKFGYFVNYGCGFSTRFDTPAVTDALLVVNWDTVTATNSGIVLNGGFTTNDLPASLYLTSKPAFFGSMPWPPFNVNSPSLALTNLPAGWRYVYGTNASF